MTKLDRLSRRAQGVQLLRSAALGGLATAIFSIVALSSASAQTPQLVTNPDGSISYVTPSSNSTLVNTGAGVSYVNPGSSALVTGPNGNVSYVTANGSPSLVYGPNGTLSYQNVIVGSNGYQSAIGFTTPNDGSSTSASVSTVAPLVSNNVTPAQIVQETRPYAIPMTVSQVNGHYCELPNGGGQVWVPAGSPSGDANCNQANPS
jgi:hypothetical protein